MMDDIDGTPGNDNLFGTSGADAIYGGAGDDTITPGGGADLAQGDAGADTIVLANLFGDDTIHGGADTDTLDLSAISGGVTITFTGTAGSGTVTSGSSTATFTGIEQIILSAGNDSIHLAGFNGTIALIGFQPPIINGDGTYTLRDRFVTDLAAGDITITGAGGSSEIAVPGGVIVIKDVDPPQIPPEGVGFRNPNFIVEGTGSADLIDILYTGDPQGDRIDAADNLAGNDDDFILAGGGADTIFSGAGNDMVVADLGDDRVTGGAGNDTLMGGFGNDLLAGSDGDDEVHGEAGDDDILGDTGNDIVYGGLGNDLVLEGAGEDSLYGGASRDTLDGGADNDLLDGGTEDDVLFGQGGDDTLIGGAGADSILGGFGNDSAMGDGEADTIRGEAGNDTLDGGDGDDFLLGGTEDDSLTGGIGLDQLMGEQGNDTLDGGDDDDYLFGGIGNDEVSGGRGEDWLRGDEGDDWIYGGGDRDTIFGDAGNDAAYGGDDNDQIEGREGDDFLHGMDGDDRVYGGVGNDLVFGQDGNDSLYGGENDDFLEGHFGNDRLYGEAGFDELEGNEGDDVVSGGEDNDLVYGGADNDSVFGGDGNDFVDGDDGEDEVYGGADNDTVQGGLDNDLLYGGDGGDILRGEGGDDRLEGGEDNDDLFGGTGNDSLLGELGDDVLMGDADNDSLYGGDGNDSLLGGVGNDLLYGGVGDDTLEGEDGNDTLDGMSENDVLFGGDGDDDLTGGDGNDTLSGGLKDDTLEGDRGDDALSGDEGNDFVLGGEGNDTISGGDGNDLLSGDDGDDVISAGAHRDNVSGGEGNDTIDAGADNDWVEGDAGNDVILGAAGTDDLFGGMNDDLIDGGADNDYIYGDDGNDTLIGGGGVDVLFGGIGNDSIAGGAENDILEGDSGDDILSGDDGDDTLTGGMGNDTLSGGENDDILYGELGDDSLAGGTGVDWIDGGGDNDAITGDEGNDSLLGGLGDDTIDGGADDDDILGEDGNDVLSGGVGHDVIQGGDGNDLIDGGEGENTLLGDAGDDTITGGDSDDQLDGGEGNDVITAAEGDDFILGGNGSDDIDAGTGSDYIDAGDGDNTVTAGQGNDSVLAGIGNDVIDGGDGNDEIDAGEGDDTIRGGRGADLIVAGIGNDVIDGGDEADTITADEGNDVVVAGVGNDSVEGGAGDDSLTGDTGRDFLIGDAGNDVLDGGADDDTLDGGDHNDTIAAGFGADLVFGGLGDDEITGGDGQDLLDGGDDNDLILGDADNDLIFGGQGDDTALGGAGVDYVYGEDGNDLLAGDGGNDVLFGDDGDDSLFGDDGDDYLSGGAGRNLILGGAGNDTIAVDLGDTGNLNLTFAPQPAEGEAPSGAQFSLVSTIGEDLVAQMEVLQFSTHPDRVVVGAGSTTLLTEALTVDLTGGTEVLDFSSVSASIFADRGVFFRNGFVAVANPLMTAGYAATNYFGALQPLFVAGLLKAEEFFVSGTQPFFNGYDSVILTESDDRFSVNTTENGMGDNVEIDGGGGQDVLYVSAPISGSYSLNGGRDNDIVIALDGKSAKTIGGLGRDVIINFTPGGELIGDTIDGKTPGPDGKLINVPDDGTNADHFWYAPRTTILDPQINDVLTFYGLPLVGGDAAAGSLGWALAGATGVLDVVSTVTGMVGTASFFASLVTLGSIKAYFDPFLPNIVYVAEGSTLRVVNQTDVLFSIILGGTSPEVITTAEGTLDLRGWQTIENYKLDIGWNSLFPFAPKDLAKGEIDGLVQLAESAANITGQLGMKFAFPSAMSIIMGLLKAAKPALEAAPGGIGMLFKAYSALDLVNSGAWLAGAWIRYAKNARWADGEDPLIIDLDGDGIETVQASNLSVYFDLDLDSFAERSGWVGRDDGFLVRDLNDNGQIDDISEMFGGQFGGGYAHLAQYDLLANGGDGDGRITAADAIWAELRVWRDADQDGETDAGELLSLDALGILAFDLTTQDLEGSTPQGTELLATGLVEMADGTTRRMFDSILPSSQTDTRYAGESGLAAWQQDVTVQSRGYGSTTDLTVAMANDIAFGSIVTDAASAMTSPDFRTLVNQVQPVLEYWGQTLETTRELVPVLLETDGEGNVTLADYGVYVEDATGGFWALNSGAPILDAGGLVIDRPTLQDLMAQATGAGQTWQLEQAWSPATRGAEVAFRDPAPYLVHIVDDRAVIDDYGIQQPDGSWQLASGRVITDSAGNPIAQPTVADILALSKADGQEWRVENIGFNPYADVPVDRIGVRFTDGVAVDYTVEVTDEDGSFLVWARNLDRALELQFKTGDSREFVLRNYAVDLDTLSEVGVSLDSTYRVEILTPGAFHYALSMGGVDFHEEMLTATLDGNTGLIDYKTIEGGSYSASTEEYDSFIRPMIELVGLSMEQFFLFGSRLSVRLALQGGLADFAQGLTYDITTDRYRPTTDRELAPMFEAIFAGAPPSNDGDAVYDYLQGWSAILQQVYPEYQPADPDVFFDSKASMDQPFVVQMALAAYENVPIDLDILALANALGVDERRIVTHEATDTLVTTQEGVNFFYLTGGNQTFVGSYPADAQGYSKEAVEVDIYYVGANSGDDVIYDLDLGDNDQLRFLHLTPDDLRAERDGEDLLLTFTDGSGSIRLVDQFLGELNELLSDGTRLQTGVDEIVFADGSVWNRYRMSFAVVDFDRAELDEADSYFGSGSGDILFAGLGNDYLSGGAGGDTYVFRAGDGRDIINDLGSFSFGPIEAGMDFLMFRGDLTRDSVRLTRDGNSPDLLITLLDENGDPTGDSVTIEGQFGGMRLNLGFFSEPMGTDTGLDYIAPNLIEKIIFETGPMLAQADIIAEVLANARTDGDDAIYGMLNDNTLDGGAGDDFLTGFQGFDTYVFGRGYGQDVIIDDDLSLPFGSKDDLLRFTDDLRWTDLDFLRDGNSDTLRLRVSGTTDEVVLTDYLKEVIIVGYTNLIEEIEFGDGTVWTICSCCSTMSIRPAPTATTRSMVLTPSPTGSTAARAMTGWKGRAEATPMSLPPAMASTRSLTKRWNRCPAPVWTGSSSPACRRPMSPSREPRWT